MAEVNLGRHKEAALHFTECLQNSTDTGDIIGSLLGIARVALQTNQALFAGRLLGFCKCLVESGLETFQYNKEYERGLAELKAELDAHAREHAMSEGLAMTLEQAMALALEVQAE